MATIAIRSIQIPCKTAFCFLEWIRVTLIRLWNFENKISFSTPAYIKGPTSRRNSRWWLFDDFISDCHQRCIASGRSTKKPACFDVGCLQMLPTSRDYLAPGAWLRTVVRLRLKWYGSHATLIIPYKSPVETMTPASTGSPMLFAQSRDGRRMLGVPSKFYTVGCRFPLWILFVGKYLPCQSKCLTLRVGFGTQSGTTKVKVERNLHHDMDGP